jgi:CRISPR-associated protein Csd1
MILRALYELYDRLASDADYGIAPAGFSYQRISFVVVINEDGSLHAVEDARSSIEGRLQTRRVLVPGGAKKTGSGLNPCFLWDNRVYVLGYDPHKPERAVQAFNAFRDRHLGLERTINLPEFSAVCRFLERWNPAEACGHPILDEVGPGFGVFQIRGHPCFVHDHQSIREWWEAQLNTEDDAPEGQCIVTGEFTRLARLHPPIKGVRGAQPNAAIVSFNLGSYESYGKSQSFNAPVSLRAATRYTSALNALLDGPQRDKHRLDVGDCTVAFWTDRPSSTEDIFLRFAAEGSASLVASESQDTVVRAKLEAFLRALRKGEDAYTELEESPETTSYYILGLSPNAARVVVRFFHHGTLSQLLQNLRRHFSDMASERQWGEGTSRPDPEFPPVYLLLRQTAREAKDVPPVLGGSLLRAIVTGAGYPAGLYQAVIRRIAIDRTVNYPRACVIKGYLVRNLRKEVSVGLDYAQKDPAYRVGRLFAVLEKTQEDALGRDIVKTIRDSFYSAASATPATVFPRLLRTYQHHLAKLEGGLRTTREKLVQEILDPIDNFPTHLALPQQGLFALGYYHQRNDLFRSRESEAQDT